MEINRDLKQAIKENNLVIFAGSGLSKRFNLPDWKKMVKDLIAEIGKPTYQAYLPLLDLEEDGMSPLEVLDKLKNERSSINRYIKEKFRINDGNFSLHKKLFELTGQIITTNFDNAFERAVDDKIIPTNYTSTFNVSEIEKNGEPFIFKIHGSLNESDKCVVFLDQYSNIYKEKNSAIKEKLKSIFINKVFLFIGFSFNDPDIKLIFESLDETFENNNKHFILTTNKSEFRSIKFLSPILIRDYEEIDNLIDECLKLKSVNFIEEKINTSLHLGNDIKSERKVKIALLSPNPIDIDISTDFDHVFNCFDSLNVTIYRGALNTKTLSRIEDYDFTIVLSKTFKGKIYVEDENLKSNLLDPKDIYSFIPNEDAPIVFITNERIETLKNCNAIYISTYKSFVINKFIYKTLKCNELNFTEDEIEVNLTKFLNEKIEKGNTKFVSIYGNDKPLDIGKKCLTNVIGRVEEQASMASRIISITKTNRVLNIKASGGTGKTTLVKKIAYELYERGFFVQGVNFKSCENIKTLGDFEEVLIEGFGLNNIVNFREYLTDNFSNSKLDKLIILDNFESVVNELNKDELKSAIDLLNFSTDFINIVITSRESITSNDDFEDIFSLTPLITDDALKLFIKSYGQISSGEELKVLREDILENLLNNNPLAIQLVTKSRLRYEHITDLRDQLAKHFFESINEDYTLVFKNNADLNIERTKSIYQSINYSYKTLNSKESIAFELLSLFPDGISLSNFKKCFERKFSSNHISDKELRTLRDKSLIEDYNGTLQLQPIIRRFAEYQFAKRSRDTRTKYCLDAYTFNCFILEFIELVNRQKTSSQAIKIYINYKNNLLNVLNYMPDILIDENGSVRKKDYLLNFIFKIQQYVINEKQIQEFVERLSVLKVFFVDLKNAELLLESLISVKSYFHKEFDGPYTELANFFTVNQMICRNFKEEDLIEMRYKDLISSIHSMEGFTLEYVRSFILNNDFKTYLQNDLFYLGIQIDVKETKHEFYYFEYQLMFGKLNIRNLEDYISELYMEEHLEIMQCTYVLSKVRVLDKATIQKLVVTNPYTKGLKELMRAFIETDSATKIKLFKRAINNLKHIKYYYLEAIYFYCIYLKELHHEDYAYMVQEGLSSSKAFKYQYLNSLFENIEDHENHIYKFSYDYYDEPKLEEFVKNHNKIWSKNFENKDI